jgi:hypothetical protein
MVEEQSVTAKVRYRIVKNTEIESYFSFDLEADDSGFYHDGDGDLLGAVVAFKEYPDHETLTSIFDALLLKAVMKTKNADEDEAQVLIEDCGSEEDYPDELDVCENFSVFFTVAGHEGLYRMLLECNDYRVEHSTGQKKDRWEV